MSDELNIHIVSTQGQPIVIDDKPSMEITFQETPFDVIEVGKVDLRVEVLSSVAGAKADSLYDIAVRNGYTGTEAEFLEWLKSEFSNIVQTTGDSTTDVMSQKAVTDELNAIKQYVAPVTVLFERTSSSPIEYTGFDAVVTLAWEIRQAGSLTAPTSVTINGAQQSATATGTVTMNVNTLGVTTFTLTAVVDGITVTATADVALVAPIYYGFCTDDLIPDVISKLSKRIGTSVDGDYTSVNEVEGNFLYVCIPADLSLSEIQSAGIMVPMKETQESLPVGQRQVQYKAYKSASEHGMLSGEMKYHLIS